MLPVLVLLCLASFPSLPLLTMFLPVTCRLLPLSRKAEMFSLAPYSFPLNITPTHTFIEPELFKDAHNDLIQELRYLVFLFGDLFIHINQEMLVKRFHNFLILLTLLRHKFFRILNMTVTLNKFWGLNLRFLYLFNQTFEMVLRFDNLLKPLLLNFLLICLISLFMKMPQSIQHRIKIFLTFTNL